MAQTATRTPNARTGRAPSPWLVLAVVSLAQFMVVLDTTIVNVALPSIQRGLGFAASDLQWVINAYLLTFGGFLLLGGRAGDLLGRRRLFLAGVITFAAGSFVSGIAPSTGALVAGRALQGLGGALVSPAALSTLTTTFTDARGRARALGVWSGISAGSGAIGLILGGVLTSALSWRWIFLVNLPVAAVAVAAALLFVPESRAELRRRSFDIAGAVSVTAGLSLLTYSLVNAQGWGWESLRTVSYFAAAAILLVGFVVIELRSSFPLVQLEIFRNRALAVGDAAMFLTGSGLFAMFFFTSLYVQDIMGYSPIRSGFALLPLTAGIITGAATAQQLIGRVGVRVVAPAGLLIAAAGMVLLTGISVTSSYATGFLPGLVIVSLGMGVAFAPLTLLATSGVDAEHAGLASGLFNTMSQVGGALGLAVLSTVAANRTADALRGAGHITVYAQLSALVDGFHVAYVAAAILLVAAAALMVLSLRRHHVAALSTAPATEAEAA